MKGKNLKIIIIICLAALLTLGTAACSNSFEKRLLNSVSEMQCDVYTGESQSFKVSLISGRRENPYVLDGVSKPKIDFSVISVTPKEAIAPDAELKYSLAFNNKNYTGSFVANPFGTNYTADLAKQINAEEPLVVRITLGDIDDDVTLNPKIAEGMISAHEALNVAETELKEIIDACKESGEINFEIYVKFITDPINLAEKYYWYVAFINRDNEYNAVLIDPITSEVVAKKLS